MTLPMKQRTSFFGIFFLLLVLVLPILFSEKTDAAAFQEVMVRLDRLSASTATGGTICAKPQTVGTESDVQITFPTVAGTDFTVNATATNWDVTTTNLPSGAIAWPGIGAEATNVTGKVVTFSSTDLVVGTLYCFNFVSTSTLTTGAAGNNQTGTITTRTGAAATIDTSGYALSVVSNDQIVVSATVPPTFTFSLSGNTDAFTANLSTSIVSTTGRTVTISTNADSGWVAWVKSANAALNSAGTGASIATAGTVNDTPEDLDSVTGYVLDVDITTDSGTGTGAVQQNPGYGDEYAGADATQGGSLSTTFQPIAEATGTTAGDVLTLTERAKITAVQAAATDYTDTLTVVAAGRF